MEFDSITISVVDEDDDIMRTKRFRGNWLFMEVESDDPNVCCGVYWSAAVTEKGRFVVTTGCRGEDVVDSFGVYENFRHMEDNYVPSDIISAIANATGAEYAVDLDI